MNRADCVGSFKGVLQQFSVLVKSPNFARPNKRRIIGGRDILTSSKERVSPRSESQ